MDGTKEEQEEKTTRNASARQTAYRGSRDGLGAPAAVEHDFECE